MNARRNRRLAWMVAGLLLIGALPELGRPLAAQVNRGGRNARPAPPQSPPLSEDARAVVRGNNRFAFDLYHRLRAENSGNLFYSPCSISTALAMTYAGARGETATQMARALHFDLPPDRLHPAYRELTGRVLPAAAPGQTPPYILTIANRLWGQEGYDFLPDYLRLTREQYGTELAVLDFRKSEAARGEINKWIEERTERKIADLIPPGAIDDMTRLVLTNAIYFKGDWAKPFEKRATEQADFHVAPEKTVKVPMMFRNDRLAYADLGHSQLLMLPYSGDAVSMWVLLPKPGSGLAALEEQLTEENVAQWMNQARHQEVRVYLPRFRLTEQFELNGVLKALGMVDAFVPDRADFSGMNGRRDLSINAVVHKAFVDVNEEGTEAAAATGVIVGVTSAPAEPLVFRADRPFVFVIRDSATGSLLFVGRVVNPGAE